MAFLDRAERVAANIAVSRGLQRMFTCAANAHAELSCRQMAFLACLAAGGGHSTAHYAEALGVSKPVITRACDRLILLGLCSRRGNDFDKRKVVLSIAPAGFALLARVAAAQAEN